MWFKLKKFFSGSDGRLQPLQLTHQNAISASGCVDLRKKFGGLATNWKELLETLKQFQHKLQEQNEEKAWVSDKEGKCGICMDKVCKSQMISLACLHRVCSDCIADMDEHKCKMVCPYCKVDQNQALWKFLQEYRKELEEAENNDDVIVVEQPEQEGDVPTCFIFNLFQ